MNGTAEVIAGSNGSGGPFDFFHTMKGPQFLILYFVWFLLTFGTVLVLRWRGYDSMPLTLVGLVLFLGAGIARIIIGSSHGMHKWEFLVIEMIVGSFCFVIRVENLRGGSSNGSSWWSCSSGGGCGGGGCGGGGCGGCGGS